MTELTDRERALVDAVRCALSGMVWNGFDDVSAILEQAIRAYDPPKPKVYVLPLIGSMTARERGAILAVFTGNDDQRIAAYNAIRELTAKEQE